MNLAEFPIAVLSTRANKNIKTLEFTDQIKNTQGRLVERKWIITGADKFGLPTCTDDDVVLGLIKTSMNHGFKDRKVYFSRYELLKTLHWSTEGRSYKRLIKSLDRLSGVRIRSSNSFYDNSSKSYQTRNFGVIDAYEINDERINKDRKKSFFIWSEAIFESFKAGFIKKIDLNFYFNLKCAASRRLYRYFDKHFYFRSSIEDNLQKLAFEKIGLSRNYKYISSIKQQLEPALDELCEKGFLSSYSFSGRGEATKIRVNSSKFQEKLPIDQIKETNLTNNSSSKILSENNNESGYEKSAPPQELLSLLVKRGIHINQAKKLLTNRSVSDLLKIPSIVSYFDTLVANKDKKISINPQGFLYRAVQYPNKFIVPNYKNNGYNNQNNNGLNKRPERKPFKNYTENNTKNGTKSHLKSIANTKYTFEKENLIEVLKKKVEKKVSFLKGILSEDKYQEAFTKCLQDEFKKANLSI